MVISRQTPPLRDGLAAALAPLGGALLAAAFPDPGWSLTTVPAVAVLFVLALTAPPRRAFGLGWLYGFVFFAVLVRWLSAAIVLFSDLGTVLAAVAVLSGSAVEGLGCGLLAWTLARWRQRYGIAPALALAPVLMVAWERARESVPFPFPWGALAVAGYGQAPGAVTSAAAAVGSLGVSLCVALMAAALATLVFAPRRGLALLLAVLLVFTVTALGGSALRQRAGRAAPLHVAVLQGSVDREQIDGFDQFQVYADLTRQAAQAGAQLVIWPESASPFDIDGDRLYRAQVEDLAHRLQVDLVLGTDLQLPDDRWQTAAVLVTRNQGWIATAPKVRLVPFGEYLPLRPLLGNLPALATATDFVPGAHHVVLRDAQAPAGEGAAGATTGLAIGPMICFEAVFSGIGRDLADRGARLLVNQTNDTWFGATCGPRQHLIHGVLRAAETGRPIARAANGGISALIDERGRIVKELGLEVRGLLDGELAGTVRVLPGAAVGRIIGGVCATLGLVAVLAAVWWYWRSRPPRRAGIHAAPGSAMEITPQPSPKQPNPNQPDPNQPVPDQPGPTQSGPSANDLETTSHA